VQRAAGAEEAIASVAGVDEVVPAPRLCAVRQSVAPDAVAQSNEKRAPSLRRQNLFRLLPRHETCSRSNRDADDGGSDSKRSRSFDTRMWANAQRDGRPAEFRWRPLFSAAKVG